MEPNSLLPLDDAIRAVLAAVPDPGVTTIELEHSLGLVLAEDVHSDLDMPPFRKSMMDGFAVRASDLAGGGATLPVAMTVPAGAVPAGPLPPGAAARIMTGAPVPEGADAVVIVERTEALPDGTVRLADGPAPGQNVTLRGEDAREGDLVLPAGREIGPAEIAVLATVGRVAVPVRPRPRVRVHATGDELVPPSARPGPGRIRESNSRVLAARLLRDGAAADPGGILPDRRKDLLEGVRDAVSSADLVLLSGGVSMGERDLLPNVLEEAGVRRVFHRIRLKPGKPVLFGVAGRKLVFGLPGNPVSVAVTYELLVRPAIRMLLGRRPLHRPRVRARLATPAPAALPREQYLPARLALADGGFAVSELDWHGSADLIRFADANALLVVPAGGPAPRTGDPAEAVVLDGGLEALLGEGGR